MKLDHLLILTFPDQGAHDPETTQEGATPGLAGGCTRIGPDKVFAKDSIENEVHERIYWVSTAGVHRISPGWSEPERWSDKVLQRALACRRAAPALCPLSMRGRALLPLHSRRPPMIGRLNHVAIAVPDLAAASASYRDMLGASVGSPQAEAAHGVTVVFIELPNTKIELLEPLGETSPILGFLAKNPSGGIHHVCYEVDDIIAARDHLRAAGARVLGDGEPKIGAHGKPVLFLHPKDFNGALVELEQA